MTIKLGIVIGRFQPVHKGHIRNVIAPACNNSDYVLFLLGSANRSTNSKNPFSAAQREEMIRGVCESVGFHKKTHLKFEGISDFKYSDNRWLQQVQSRVSNAVNAIEYVEGDEVEITLFGVEKDGSSYYLSKFPAWKRSLGQAEDPSLYNATNVRERLYQGLDSWRELLPPTVKNWIDANYKGSELEEAMIAEYDFINKYKSQFEKPLYLDEAIDEVDSYDGFKVQEVLQNIAQRNYYPPTFTTVDSVVLFQGQVLLIKRGHQPGKGLWALPGGFLQPGKRLLQAAINETKEETRFRLRPEWLKAQHVFDDPERSLRGRTITHGFLFQVPDQVPDGTMDHIIQAQFIEGSDDAAHAQWVPLATALEDEQFTHHMFEDHADILYELVSRA